NAGFPGWKRLMVLLRATGRLGNSRLDGGSHNEKNEQGRAEQECAEHVHGQNLLRQMQYRCGNWLRTVLPVTADGDVIWPASITSPAPPPLRR
ncbi:MAG: hypothetical protein ACXVZJ_11700, partial [Terriglobales bacterium]